MLHDVKTKSYIPKLPNELLWKGRQQKTEIKMPRGRERNVSIVALLIPKGKGNPEGQELLKVIKNHYSYIGQIIPQVRI